jgi:hypothetical protein
MKLRYNAQGVGQPDLLLRQPVSIVPALIFCPLYREIVRQSRFGGEERRVGRENQSIDKIEEFLCRSC